ncbi:MAG: peptide ABC transporter substrate-binding protein [Fimbriimonadaceae bacterium]
MRFVAALLALSFIYGCSGDKFKQPTSQSSVLVYAIPNKPTTLDPGVVQDSDTIEVLQQVFEGLVGWDENNQPTGILAENWEFQKGGKVILFHLKKGVKFHNGREVKAADFKWSWERVCSAELKSTASSYMTDIVGAKELIEGKATQMSGVKVVDDYTLSVELDTPKPYFLGKMVYVAFAAVAKEAQDGLNEMKGVTNMVGTGPFKAARYENEQLVVLEANKDYHGGAPKIDRIERPVVLDAQTRLNKYKNGELDLCLVQRADVEGIMADGELSSQLKFMDLPSVFFLGFNSSGLYPPFKDRRVRRAFAMAIDRSRIVNTYMKGINTEAHGIIPPGVMGHRDRAADIPFDPEGARKLLAEAGYPGGKGMPLLELRYREGYRDISLVAEAACNDLVKNLGVKVQAQSKEWKALLDAYNRGQNAFFHMRWKGDYLDPQNFISHMHASFGPENHSGYVNPTLDQLCREADRIVDPKERTALYQKAEDIALQDATWVPVYYQRDALLTRPGVSGIRTNAFGFLPHTATVVKKQPKTNN